jgi:hypothetical protein
MTDATSGGLDVERYEQLRSQALDGGSSGFRLGLALLERRGVAAWSRSWQTTVPEHEPQHTPSAVVELPAAPRELVDVLADMALARVAAG